MTHLLLSLIPALFTVGLLVGTLSLGRLPGLSPTGLPPTPPRGR